jgi:TolB-like protein/DNA-binding winged helix-turn-helix (wHTH) protein/Tfp pilus assembly protein PilF
MSDIDNPNNRLYEFGSFRLDTGSRLLTRRSDPIGLPPKAFDLLVLLVQNRGRVIQKKELMDALWPDAFVEEANLTQNVFLLRKALGDEADCIKTVPRIGYRFQAAVRELTGGDVTLVNAGRARVVVHEEVHEEIIEHEEDSPGLVRDVPMSLPATTSRRVPTAFLIIAAVSLIALIGGTVWLIRRTRTVPVAEATPAIDSIAVLPFSNQAADADSEYLSDGIAESLINSLAQLKGLRVVPRSTVFRYKSRDVDPQTVGHELRVRAVVVGRVLRRGDTLSVQTELIDVDRDSQLWGEQYNRNVSDLLAIQESIATEISQRLRLQLSPTDRQVLARGSTANPKAYDLYLKGMHYTFKFTKDGFGKGAEFFNQAIDVDPNYALAYNGLAFNYINSIDWLLPPNEGGPKARKAAEQALAIDELLADSHCSRALIADWYDWDWVRAEREFKRGIELNPNEQRCREFYSWLLGALGRHSEAIAEAKQAVQIDPVSAEAAFTLGSVLVFAGQYDQAIEQLRTSVELDQSYWFAHDFLGRAYLARGNLDKAIAEYKTALELDDSNTESWSNLAHAYARAGKRAETQKILMKLNDMSKQAYVAPYNLAVVYAGLGDKNQAFAWLEKAYAARSGALAAMLTTDVNMDPLRSDPRFKDLLHRMNLAR